MTQINVFRGDLVDVSAKLKAPLKCSEKGTAEVETGISGNESTPAGTCQNISALYRTS